MEELICFSAFLYQYIEFFVFLKVARRGGAIAPPTPPLNPSLLTILTRMFKFHFAQFFHSCFIINSVNSHISTTNDFTSCEIMRDCMALIPMHYLFNNYHQNYPSFNSLQYSIVPYTYIN